MCGIAGMAGVRDSALLDAMLKITRHRGPDDRGTYLTNGTSPEFQAAIGCNRLKVLDLSSAGHQPMSSPDGGVWVVYNGEIFNFAALREELCADGWSFRSQADTEVLPLPGGVIDLALSQGGGLVIAQPVCGFERPALCQVQ